MSMENFEKAFKEVINIEGGYVNNESDRGGETKYGISKRWYPNVDIKNLSLDVAKAIYFKDFWQIKNLSLNNLSDFDIALELFDTSVNMGNETAGKILQKALNKMNRNERLFEDLKVDGFLGDKTLKILELILNRHEKQSLLKILNGEQYMLYSKIIEKDETQEINFVGWMKRINYDS